MANASEHGFLKDKKNREDTTRLNGSVIKQMCIYIYLYIYIFHGSFYSGSFSAKYGVAILAGDFST